MRETNDANIISYDMGYTADEFSRVLNGEFSGDRSIFRSLSCTPGQWRIEHKNEQDFCVHIRIQQKPPRRLGAMNLPVLQVDFKLQSGDQRQTDHFFDKFFKYFHKGGG